MKTKLLRALASAFLVLPAATTMIAVPSAALAQPAAPQIRSLEASADGRLEPGTRLTFTLEGTPRSRATVRIRGLRQSVPLTEVRRGEYVGSYTIQRGDRLDGDAEIRASLRDGNTVGTADYELAEILPRQRAPAPVPRAPELRIERFGMAPIERIEPGAELQFAVEGMPGARVTVDLPGVDRDVALRETRPGHYEGGYTVRRSDDFNPNRPAVATLRLGDRVVTANLPIVAGRGGGGNRPGPDNRPPPNVDNRAPTLTFLVPAEGATVAPGPSVHIAATFEDAGGSGVDPASVQIVVSGRNVTRDAQITRQSLSFWGALPVGRHTVEVTGRDTAGNALRHNWSFTVGVGAPSVPVVTVPVAPPPPPPPQPPRGAVNLAAQVVNHAPNAEIGPDPVLVRGRTAPGAQVQVNVRAVAPQNVSGPPSRILFSQTLQADREGTFSFTLVPGIPIPGTRYDIDMVARRDNLSQESRFTLFER